MQSHPLTIFEIQRYTRKTKNIKANIFRVQANDSVLCGYFCIGFINFSR